MSIPQNLKNTLATLPTSVTMVAVSKTKPIHKIQEAYQAGQRIFGENKVQEMVEKHHALPKDILWHMIGHLQSNKIKYMASFVDLIHGVDKLSTLKEINKQAKKHQRIIKCLLQVKIAEETTKFGLTQNQVIHILNSKEYQEMENVKIVGFMGMASFVEKEQQIKNEFQSLNHFYLTQKKQHLQLEILSMGMSGDYKIAIQEGSTMVRIGSAIFGHRN